MRSLINVGVITISCFTLVGISRASKPMEIDLSVYSEAPKKFEWAWQRFNKTVTATADKWERGNAERERRPEIVENDFCVPEFAPVPMAAIAQLPKPRTIEQVRNILGLPCKTDDDTIYYQTESGEIVFFDKRTGEGGFQG